MRGFRRWGEPDPGPDAPEQVLPTTGSEAPSGGVGDSTTIVIDRMPAGPAHAPTEVLDSRVAAALADPGASTQVLSRAPAGGSGAPLDAEGADGGDGVDPAGGSGPTVTSTPAPLGSRRVAAEIGMYAGAALVLISVGGVVARGWSAWEPGVRWAFAGLTTVALVAAGLFVRLPWSRSLGDERRRAVSALLTTGVAVAATGVSVALGSGQGALSADPGNTALALCVVVAMVVVNAVARTPVSESGLLGALVWSAWVVVPPGPGTWAFLVALGAVWAGLGARWARGRRTAMVLGAAVALVASVGMAAGPWAWPTRAGQAAVAVLGLGAFLRGRANHWLALGAGAATALAASVAGDVVGPALALLVGGLATMVVSWIALRSARRGA
jgi:hypothetical protein